MYTIYGNETCKVCEGGGNREMAEKVISDFLILELSKVIFFLFVRVYFKMQ